MNEQTIKAAGFAINRVLKDEPIQPGNMIQYLEEKRQSLLVVGCDLKHEVAMGLAEKVEPGFYEKLFAELHAEVDMVTSIIETLKGGAMDSAPKQTTLDDVIDYLEYVQLSTTEDIAIFRKEIETPAEMNNNEAAQDHFKMLLDETVNEQACLNVVIGRLKEECDCETYECDDSQEVMNIISEERQAKDEVFLATIRARRAELLKGGV